MVVVRIDLKKYKPSEEMNRNKSEWRSRIYVTNPYIVGTRL